MLFSMNASKLKKHAPDAHTFLEVIGARWGNAAHLTFLFFGLLTNIIGKLTQASFFLLRVQSGLTILVSVSASLKHAYSRRFSSCQRHLRHANPCSLFLNSSLSLRIRFLRRYPSSSILRLRPHYHPTLLHLGIHVHCIRYK